MKVHLPADLLGVPRICLHAAADSLTAMTPVAARAISRSRLMATLQHHPKVAAAVFLSVQKERIGLMESLAVIGQTGASVRLGAMLINFFERLSTTGGVTGGTFHMPLTQRDIGDLIGVTPSM